MKAREKHRSCEVKRGTGSFKGNRACSPQTVPAEAGTTVLFEAQGFSLLQLAKGCEHRLAFTPLANVGGGHGGWRRPRGSGIAAALLLVGGYGKR